MSLVLKPATVFKNIGTENTTQKTHASLSSAKVVEAV